MEFNDGSFIQVYVQFGAAETNPLGYLRFISGVIIIIFIVIRNEELVQAESTQHVAYLPQVMGGFTRLSIYSDLVYFQNWRRPSKAIK